MTRRCGRAGSRAGRSGLMLKFDQGLCMRGALGARGGLAWMELPYRRPDEILKYVQAVEPRFDNVVVLGIGGSALGTIALSTALRPQYADLLPREARGGHPRLFVVDNADPDQICALFANLNLSRTLVNVISKSGSTAETMAAYMVARGLVEKTLGRGHVRDHFVFTTGPDGGALRDIGRRESIKLFDIPNGVGGRFSVLSPVGLLPLALAGVDVEPLLAGARDLDSTVSGRPVMDNPAYLFATIQFLMDTHFGRNICVMMPYSARLRDVSDWFRQLWAESLGKALDREGKTVHIGQTPVKSLGTTDQHSQV